MPPGKMPIGSLGSLGYQPSLHEDKHRRWICWVKDTGGLRAKLQEEYLLATPTAQLSRDLTTLCCHNKGPGAPRRGSIVSKAENKMFSALAGTKWQEMAGTKWSTLRAWPSSKTGGRRGGGHTKAVHIRNSLITSPEKNDGQTVPHVQSFRVGGLTWWGRV